jgi:DNA-binding NarL/FixJ family response regulator
MSAFVVDDATRSEAAGEAARATEGSGDSDQRPIRVVVADDSYPIREFLAVILSRTRAIELLDVCSNGNELRQVIAASQPDVVITDIRMPPSGAEEGIRLAMSLRETHPEIGVVVLSQYAEPAYALGLFDGGTGRRAYLLKERIRDREELLGAIEKVANGGSVIDPLVVDVLIQARERARNSRLACLTSREREVLAEIAAGKSNAAIAASLVLTKRAVEKHVNSIFSKLDLPDTADVSRRVKATLFFLDEQDDDAARPESNALTPVLRAPIELPTAGARAPICFAIEPRDSRGRVARIEAGSHRLHPQTHLT